MSGAPVRGTKEVIIAVGTTVWTGRALQARCDHLEVMVLLEERDPHVNACGSSATRPTMQYVEIKSEAQLELQSLHRVRGRLVTERTALIREDRC